MRWAPKLHSVFVEPAGRLEPVPGTGGLGLRDEELDALERAGIRDLDQLDKAVADHQELGVRPKRLLRLQRALHTVEPLIEKLEERGLSPNAPKLQAASQVLLAARKLPAGFFDQQKISALQARVDYLEAVELRNSISDVLDQGRYGFAIFSIDVFRKQKRESDLPLLYPVIEAHAPKAIEHFETAIRENAASTEPDPGIAIRSRDALDFWTRMKREVEWWRSRLAEK